ncbi:hypothetical protein FD04_GL000598 [Secundilactobacillus odoratitofui DSM 19909 = JCM 15043]|uniref:Uncharacterized protein n=1 Tax=Secundilactobacillus odoratitofui DSM 19909 = JCM 15043 TaxID=1423776 RepID=A0A0R1LTW2_9LACO|nr:hypothetical protein [Secundilactobacillus odoratitofui]KRK98856.1 hypothetical protein FD04_GL000598 [Secundilactobacillus odoratitofui DSM 19909 = JCM 15043]
MSREYHAVSNSSLRKQLGDFFAQQAMFYHRICGCLGSKEMWISENPFNFVKWLY